MQSFQPSFDAHTRALMGRAFDDAWWHLIAKKRLPCDDEGAARSIMACAIMAAVVNGERDPERLKAAAIRAFTAPPGDMFGWRQSCCLR
jgi:hypothetical protein